MTLKIPIERRKNANSTKKQSTAIRRMLVVDNENISRKKNETHFNGYSSKLSDSSTWMKSTVISDEHEELLAVQNDCMIFIYAYLYKYICLCLCRFRIALIKLTHVLEWGKNNVNVKWQPFFLLVQLCANKMEYYLSHLNRSTSIINKYKSWYFRSSYKKQQQ